MTFLFSIGSMGMVYLPSDFQVVLTVSFRECR